MGKKKKIEVGDTVKYVSERQSAVLNIRIGQTAKVGFISTMGLVYLEGERNGCFPAELELIHSLNEPQWKR